jgi:hypothetical protein
MPKGWYSTPNDMRTLEKTFVMNSDKCGNHTFTQLRREGNFALYRRDRVCDGKFHSVEVFKVKVVKAGTGYNTGDDYEQYPGGEAFGRHAWSISGEEKTAIECGNRRFDKLLKNEVAIEPMDETEVEAETSVPVVRVVSPTPIKQGLKLPDGEFSQRELASYNGFDNYKVVYSDLQKMLQRGILVLGSKRKKADGARGKTAQLFKRAQ